jgi:hypothetical protein
MGFWVLFSGAAVLADTIDRAPTLRLLVDAAMMLSDSTKIG